MHKHCISFFRWNRGCDNNKCLISWERLQIFPKLSILITRFSWKYFGTKYFEIFWRFYTWTKSTRPNSRTVSNFSWTFILDNQVFLEIFWHETFWNVLKVLYLNKIIFLQYYWQFTSLNDEYFPYLFSIPWSSMKLKLVLDMTDWVV